MTHLSKKIKMLSTSMTAY